MRAGVLTLALALAAGLALAWAAGGLDGLAAEAAAAQREAQAAMAGALRRLRAGEAGALALLLGLCFVYGIAHAAGPGHGKLLIGGYAVGSRVRLLPLAVIALAASLAQATTAVVLVQGGVRLFDWSRERMTALAEGVLDRAATAALLLIGLWLAVRGLRGLLRLARAPALPPAAGERTAGAAAVCGGDMPTQAPRPHPDRADRPSVAETDRTGPLHRQSAHPDHGDCGHRHGPHVSAGADGAEARADRTGPLHRHGAQPDHGDCGHRHGPTPADLARVRGWRDGALLVAGVALRPCTGALFLLLVTWRMGIEGAGIAGTYAMGAGVAAVTVAVGVLAVLARDGALHLGARLAGAARIAPALELGAGGVVALLALGLLLRPV